MGSADVEKERRREARERTGFATGRGIEVARGRPGPEGPQARPSAHPDCTQPRAGRKASALLARPGRGPRRRPHRQHRGQLILGGGGGTGGRGLIRTNCPRALSQRHITHEWPGCSCSKADAHDVCSQAHAPTPHPGMDRGRTRSLPKVEEEARSQRSRRHWRRQAVPTPSPGRALAWPLHCRLPASHSAQRRPEA